MRDLIGYDPELLIAQTFVTHPGDDDGVFFLHTEQDVTDLVEANKAAYNAVDERATWAGDWHRVASIPISVWFDLVRQGIANDEARLRRWMNDRDNLVFRTRPGRV